MVKEEFLKDVCPNHTEQSKWNRNELLHILELHEKQLRIDGGSHKNELLERLDKLESWAYNKATEDDLKFLNSIYRSDNCA